MGADDFYHRAASFRMLQYVCDEHVDDYDWFVRAVDDAYIRVDELLAALASLNKDHMVSCSSQCGHIYSPATQARIYTQY